MVTILAFIGLVVIIWFIGKLLSRFGSWMEHTGDTLVDISASLRRAQRVERTDSNKISDKIKGLKGECRGNEDEDFRRTWEEANIQGEIEELTN